MQIEVEQRARCFQIAAAVFAQYALMALDISFVATKHYVGVWSSTRCSPRPDGMSREGLSRRDNARADVICRRRHCGRPCGRLGWRK